MVYSEVSSRYVIGDTIRVYITGCFFQYGPKAGEPLYFTGTIHAVGTFTSNRWSKRFEGGYIVIRGSFRVDNGPVKVQFRKIRLTDVSKIELELGDF